MFIFRCYNFFILKNMNIYLNKIKLFFNSRTKEFWIFESFIGLHFLAATLISIFIPILLYKSGFSLIEILFYLFFFHFFSIGLNFVSRWFILKWGAKVNIIFSTISVILFFLLFLFVGQIPAIIFLILISILAAIYDAFFFPSIIYIFINSNKKEKNIRNNTNIITFVIGVVSLVGPIIGSILILKYDQSIAFMFVIFFFLLSFIPLFKLKEIQTKADHKPAKFKTFFQKKEEVKNFLGFGLQRVSNGVEFLLWPIFVFLFFGDSLEAVVALAILIPLSSLAFNIFNFFLNFKHRIYLLVGGAIAVIITWAIRFFFLEDHMFWFYTSAVIGIVALLAMQLSLDSGIFKRAKKVGPLATAFYRNIFSMTARSIMLGFLLILVLFQFDFQTIFYISFVISCLVSLIFIFIFLKDRKRVDVKKN